MGRQIALNTALYPYQVSLVDNNESVVEDARKWVDKYLSERLAKGKLTEEQVQSARSRLTVTDDLEKAAVNADLVIEAIIEMPEAKNEFFKRIGGIVREDAILATNSSRMPSSLFKDFITNPSRLVNIHYFHPALVMKLAEVVQGSHTSAETAQAMMDFAAGTGKNPIWLKKEIDGFVVNRLLDGIVNEAFYLVENGICTPEEIDKGAESGLNHPMGPFRLMDFSGIDLIYLQMTRKFEESGIKPAGYDIIAEKYNRGEYGRKSGKGFYEYN